MPKDIGQVSPEEIIRLAMVDFERKLRMTTHLETQDGEEVSLKDAIDQIANLISKHVRSDETRNQKP